MSVLDLARVAEVFERERAAFAAATPFPHLVVDDLFDAAALRARLLEASELLLRVAGQPAEPTPIPARRAPARLRSGI